MAVQESEGEKGIKRVMEKAAVGERAKYIPSRASGLAD